MDLETRVQFELLVKKTGKANERKGYETLAKLLMGLVEKNLLLGNKEDVKIFRTLLFGMCIYMKNGGFTNQDVLDILQPLVTA